MPLINDVKKICDRLAPLGWRDLLLQHGLDISATNLGQELTKELPAIKRQIPGFEDFAFEGKRGIQPGNPARSLLFHAFASPNVIRGVSSQNLPGFPTLGELEIVENYVYGVQPPTLQDLQVRAQRQNLAIVVFASEYRPAPETVHRKHADMCFSRTGVARVGTAEAMYNAQRRGFLPFVEGDATAFRVLPSRYSAYIAFESPGIKDSFGPLRFQPEDSNKKFWVPLHKLFDGKECIRGLDLRVKLNASHVNEKLRRIHIKLKTAGWVEPDISNPPFIFSEGIASLANNPDFGNGLLLPVVHSHLVEAAKYKGKPLTYKVPVPNDGEMQNLSSSFMISGEGGRTAPEYVHARHKVLANGKIENLNNLVDVEAAVQKGGYDALHYLDFSGDGWIDAICPELATSIPRRVPAYSLVTAPDFFPNCDQGELLNWTEQSLPSDLRQNLWYRSPETLADNRIAPNIQLKEANFRPNDKTVTTIISLPTSGSVRQMPLNVAETMRNSYLPDAAAGLFAPGWDVSHDTFDKVEHLAAYGLGSPFPEDTKLCAAISTFWPAVAPDAARTFAPDHGWPTVSPLTDEEIGQTGNLPWDGIPGPKLVRNNGKAMVEYMDFAHADYVDNSLEKKFSLSLTGKVDVKEYQARVLAMAKAYRILGVAPDDRGQWSVLSFRSISPTNTDSPTKTELKEAQTQSGRTLEGNIYRFVIYRPGNSTLDTTNPRKRLVEVIETVTVLVTAITTLIKQGNNPWSTKRI